MVRHLLLGRGLNETQVIVIEEVLAGRITAEIAERHHYARGTVNSARNASYKRLGVHSRSEPILALRLLGSV